VKIGPVVRPGRKIEKKRKDRTGQSKNTIWGEAPTVPIETKICMAGKLADLITCAKFQDDIFRGYNFTRDPISHFPIDFCMDLTTLQRHCAACDRKSHMGCRLVPKSVTLNDLERRNGHVHCV